MQRSAEQVLSQGCPFAIARYRFGPNDLWIAAHALALNLPLITNNLSEFQRVPGLSAQTWMTA